MPPRTTLGVVPVGTMPLEVAAEETADFQRRPAMVDASDGEVMMMNWPTRRDWTSTMFGDQGYGVVIWIARILVWSFLFEGVWECM